MSNETLNGNCAKRVLTNVFKMNREIKFRAWDKSCNKMRGISGLQDCFSLRSDGVCNEDYILMQYIGLKDKNGKEIYEGDILKASNSIIKIVFKGRGYEGIYLNKEEMNELPIQNNNYLHWQIIGNIYENPELTQSSE